jgi:1-acyl-sn-glycerol-3-phosphate acyltransferase
VLLVANHASYLDPPLSGVCLRRWVAFLARASLAKVPGLRWWMAKVGVTLIDREAPSKDALRAVADCLAAGQLVCIFPEGTRSPDGSVGPFRSGVEFLVRRTRAVVVPCGIDGAGRAFPKGTWLPRPRRIVVRYGEPWPPEKVLADGGVEALRALVADLAQAPLRERRSSESPGSPGRSDQNASAASEAPASPTATDSRMVRPPGL